MIFASGERLVIPHPVHLVFISKAPPYLIDQGHENHLIAQDHKNHLIAQDHKNHLIAQDHKNHLIAQDHKNHLIDPVTGDLTKTA